MPVSAIELGAFDLQGSVVIQAPPEQVWQALTADVGAWWGAPHLCCDDTVEIRLELRIGGPLYERGADGTEVLYGIVSGYTPGSFIEFAGDCGMTPPVYGSWSYALVEQDGGTRLDYRHRALGRITAERMAGYDQGWQDLLGVRLKALCETGTRLGLGSEPARARH